MAKSIQYASEFNLDVCRLYTIQESFADISNLVLSIDINENIFQNSVTGTIVLGDANNLIENMPITGQEYLDLKISTPGANKFEHTIDFTGDKKLYVYDVVARESLTSGSQVYTLSVSTIESLRNENIRISKSYTNTISNIVDDMFVNVFQTKKELFIEPTKGIRKIVVPNNHPFTLVNRLKTEAKSQVYNTPHYLFFENKNGFHFRSLQHLMCKGRDDKKVVIRKVLHCGDKNLDEDKDSRSDIDTTLFQSFMRIQRYKFESLNNWYDNNKMGILGSTLFTHNIYTKSYKKETFDYFDNFNRHNINKFAKPMYDRDMLVRDFGTFENSRIFMQPVSRVGTSITDKDAHHYKDGKAQYDSSIPEDSISDRRSKISELLSGGISINMVINGTTDLTAGDMVYITLPIIGQNHGGENFETSTTGNYLVSHLRHNFIPLTQKHEIHLRAIKDNKTSKGGKL